MTNTETKFRIWAKGKYPNGFIKKIPDFKQAGSSGAVGLPDYLVIDNGETIWYEVKSGFGDTINLKSHFTPAQKIVFNQMYQAGVDVWIYCFTKTQGEYITCWSNLMRDGKIKFE